MKRRFTLLAIATFFSTSLMAGWNGTAWTSYDITSTDDLIALATQVNAGNSFSGITFTQTADLDLGGVYEDGVWSGAQWTPIGRIIKDANNKDVKTPFSGTYDGNGYVISNLKIDDPTASYVGLFGYISGATLKNITIASGFVYGDQYSGGICGSAITSSKITCCANNATVYGKRERNGGIVGNIASKTTISNCINYGLISAYNYSGGVVGYNEATGTNATSVTNCVNVGQVFSLRNTSGNLYGFNKDFTVVDGVITTGGKVSKCFYDNQINTSLGITSVITAIETETDVTGIIEGKSTSDMIGNGLQTALGEENWYFATDMYPRLKVKVNGSESEFSYSNDAIILAATPVKFSNNEKADSVSSVFTVYSTAPVVSWTSGNSSVSINNESATVNSSAPVVLTATKGDYTKKVYLKTNNGTPGIGSINHPLSVTSETDLIELRDAVNNYGEYKTCANYDGFKGIYFIQDGKITLSTWTTSIGAHNSFKGIYDGSGDTIIVNTGGTNIVGGLFDGASYGEIKNLSIQGTVSGTSYVGGLCGSTFCEKLTNCKSYCTISADNQYVGGIVGLDKGNSIFENCVNYGTVTFAKNGGGIVGTSSFNPTFLNCINLGNITGTTQIASGICGKSTNGTIEKCENHGTITINGSGSSAGGMVGNGSTITIIDCINSGNITGVTNIGGIAGQISSNSSISTCLNIGKINATDTKAGGIIGRTANSAISISFNAGEIVSPSDCGAIVGYTENSEIIANSINIGKATSSKYCIYDKQMCPSGSTGKLTSAMLGESLNSDLDNEIWAFTEGMYPRIKSLENSDYMIVASIPLILGEGDKVSSVNKNLFSINDENIDWSCNADYIDFVDGYAYISHSSTKDSLVYVTISIQNSNKTYSKTIPLTIKQKAASLNGPIIDWTIDDPVTITYGSTVQDLLSATETNGYPGEMTYSIKKDDNSFNTNAVLNADTYTLTAKFTPSNNNINPVTKDVELVVNKAEPTITWDNPGDITYGTALSGTQLNASSAEGSNFSYSLDDEGQIAALDAVLDAGTHTLYATLPESANYSAKQVSVSIKVNKANPTITWSNPSDIVYGTLLSGTQLNASADVLGQWDYTPASGTKLDAGIGQKLKVTFTPNDNTNYNTVADSVVINVSKANPSITWSNPSDIVYGTLLSGTQLNASADVLGQWDYTPASGTKLDAGIGQKLKVTFTPNDNSNYNTVADSVTINVSKAEPSITWSNPADIVYGTAISATQLNASSAAGSNFTYSLDAAGQNAALGAVLDAGTHTLYATLPASTNYSAKQVSVSIKVNKAEPSISWSTPGDITYGTAISATQLNASSAAGSNFTYSLDAAGQNAALGAVLDAGTHTLYATLPASANYTAKQMSVSINVNKAEPSITWNNPADITYGTAISATQLNASSAAGSNFTYSLDAAGQNAALGAVLDAGTHTLYATLPASANYTAKQASVSIIVDKAEPSITWSNPADITYGTAISTTQLNASSAAGSNFTYSLDAAGQNAALGAVLDAGTHTLYATLPASTNYSAKQVSVSIIVNKAEPSITWSNPADIVYGTAISATQLNASSAAGSNFTYSLDAAGQNAALGAVLDAGTHTLYATLPASTNYSAKQVNVSIKVNKAEPSITWSNPADIVYGTAISATQLNASSAAGSNFTYSLDAAGQNAALGAVLDAGTHTLYATLPASANYTAKQMSVSINVNKAEPSITWSNPADITYGTAISATQLNASSAAGSNFTYSLDAAGQNAALGAVLDAGTHTLYATLPASTNYSAKQVSVSIKVEKANPTITWSNPADIVYGTALSGTQLNAQVDIAGTCTYSPVAGTILNAGTQTLTATFTPSNKNYNSATKSVTINVSKAEPTITWDTPADIVYGTALSGTQLNAGSDVDGKFTYNPADGSILDAGTQTLTATFAPTDANNYKSGVISVKINIAQAEPTITWENPDDIVYGTALSGTQLNAQVNAAGKCTYSPAAKTKLNAGDNQILTVTFAPTDTKNYKSVSKSVTINVSQAEPTVTWETPEDIVYGTALSGKQLNAEVDVAGKFSYSPAAGTKLNAGNQTLTATFVPNDTKNYVSVTTEVQLNVAKADAKTTWSNPADIVYGTALTSSMLNATANIDGGFKYNPDVDSILNAGVQTLSAVFTPTDTANYNTASISVQINIAKADPKIVWNTPNDIVYGTPLTDSTLNATSDVLGSFKYTPDFDSVLNAGVQTLSAVFTPTDTANYNNTSTSAKLVVAKANPEIAWNTPNDIVYGTPLTDSVLNAQSNIFGSFKYIPDFDSVLNAGVQTLSAIFTPADTNNYNKASTSVEIVVAKANPEIAWNTPNDIVYGTPLTDSTLNAQSNVFGLFEYTPDFDSILNAGVHTLSAVFTPADTNNYNKASTSVEIVVAKANPEIVWNTPNAIVYGSQIADSMLNATSIVLGDFDYSIPDDSVLNVGEYPLVALFTSADSNYNNATDTITLTVVKATLTAAAINNTIVIGHEIPEFQIEYSGFVFGDDTSSLTALATATCNVPADSIGTFEIVVSGGEADNYTFEYVNGKLTVIDVPALPVITWNHPKSLTYGNLIDSTYLCAKADVDGRFEYAILFHMILDTMIYNATPAPLGVEENNNRILSVGDTLTPGEYYLTATFYPTDATLCSVIDTTFLLVHKAYLEVSVADVTVNQGDEMPEFEISYNGFVFGENESNLNGVPQARCDASTDKAGTFDIYLYGGYSDNYEIDFINGTLTVVAKEDTTAIAETEVLLMAYPNPTNGMFVVETNSTVEYIYVYNAVGKLVATEMNVGTTRINLTNEPEGTYFVKVGEKTLKVLKF